MSGNICSKGHDMDVVGSYVYNRRQRGTGNPYQQVICRACKLHRAERKKRAPKQKTEPQGISNARLMRMDALIAKLSMASTHWERDPIQQELDRLAAGGKL